MEHIQSAIRAYFDARQEELIQAVCRLVRIDSTLGPAAPGQPFGPGPAAALDELVALAREWGLTGRPRRGLDRDLGLRAKTGGRPALRPRHR